MISDAEKLTEARRVAALISSGVSLGACERLMEILRAEMSDHDRLDALHREFRALLNQGVVPPHLRHGVEELLIAQPDSPDSEKLVEAHHLAALLGAHGHADARRRMQEILDNPMEDFARLDMLRCEAATIMYDLPPGHPLVRRLRLFSEG
jgi:hypothetical protein